MSEETKTILTKKLFMGLPEGVFIMSNIMDAPGHPTCFESVSSASERGNQWERIVLRGCNNRFFWVFKNEEEAMAYLNSRFKESPPPEPLKGPGPKLKVIK